MVNRVNDPCEAFDMAFALWYWCTHNYSKFDAKHEAFCKITGEYRLSNIPSIDFDTDEWEDEYYMAISYYHDLNEDNWKETFEAWCDYMDNEWDEAC